MRRISFWALRNIIVYISLCCLGEFSSSTIWFSGPTISESGVLNS